jgi:DNA-binding transcriptional regulator GbsR (MarR family)
MNAKKADPPRDPDGVRRFVDRFASALVAAGMPRMPALVFVALLASDSGRLTADQLIDELGISRSAVSGAVGYLTQVGILRREREPGSRRDVYALLDDSWYEMVARREQLLDVWIDSARFGVDALGAATPAGSRMSESLAFFEFIQAEMAGMLERWQAIRARRRHG